MLYHTEKRVLFDYLTLSTDILNLGITLNYQETSNLLDQEFPGLIRFLESFFYEMKITD